MMGVEQRAGFTSAATLCLHFFLFPASFLFFFIFHVLLNMTITKVNLLMQQQDVSFPTNSEFYRYISRSLTAIFSSSLSQRKGMTQHTVLQIEARKKGSVQKQFV